MRKAIAFISCTTLLAAAVSLWLASGREPSNTASAQVDGSGSPFETPSIPSQHETTARRLMEEARKRAAMGNVEGARKLAERASTFRVQWGADEQNPQQFVQSLGTPAATEPADPFAEPDPLLADDSPSTGAGTIDPVAFSKMTSKQQATTLLSAARADLKEGRIEDARKKALQARQLQVAYSLFEERPDHILNEIERKAASITIANSNQSDNGNAPAPSANPSSQSEAQALLKAARMDIAQGNFEQARQKAVQAQQLEVVYGVFDDRPELVLSELARQSERNSVIADGSTAPSDPAAAAAESRHQEVAALLKQARADLKAGQIELAREKALAASELEVAYDVFDDRPELVLAEIERSLTTPDVAQTPAAQNQANVAQYEQAQSLLKEARAALAAGELEQARAKAAEAQSLNVTYRLFDDRPDLVLDDITRHAAQDIATATPPATQTNDNVNPFANDAAGNQDAEDPFGNEGVQTAGAQTGNPNTGRATLAGGNDFPPVQADQASNADPFGSDNGQPAVISPAGATAVDHYNQGLHHLRRGDRAEARTAFLKAYTSGESLDRYRRQQLQDFLRELTPRDERIQLVQGQDNGAGNDQGQPSELDIVSQQQALQYDRLRTEVLNAVFRAERLKESDSDQALEILDRATAKVETSGVPRDAAMTLLRHINNTQDSIQGYQQQMAPLVEMQRSNEETREAIRRDQEALIQVEQEVAKLVDEYNTLFNQQRYAEAEIVAKKARELDSDNPVTVTMEWKAKFARRIQRDEEIKELRDEGIVRQLQDVDLSAVNPVASDSISYPDAKTWKELTDRRENYRENRTQSEEEKRIEKSLTRQVSLHFENQPLRDVMRHISTVANVNVVLDSLGLDDEGVSTNDPVSIDVDGIRLKSALKLLLEPKKLAYTIEDDVLKITSYMRQQGKLNFITYPVADLVVPISNYAAPAGTSSGFGATDRFGGSGSQFSVPAGGFQNGNGQAFFQVNDGNGFGSGSGFGNSFDAPAIQGNNQVDFESLMDLIVTTVSPESWSEVGGAGTIRHSDSTLSLVIRQTQTVHEEIADLLSQLRRLQDLQVTVEVRFIAVSDRFFERIGVDFDFNVQDTLGTPAEYPSFGQFDGGGQQGQGGQQQQQQGQQQGQQQQGATNSFESQQRRTPARDGFPPRTVVGLSAPDTFTPDFDVAFQQGSFEVGVPDFGNFNPEVGIQFGFAILSDIEAFFFIQAAQADERANLMFAPKVTLFNGQTALVRSIVQRPFVISLTPTVGFFSVGFTPEVQLIPEGIQLSVQAVISADRRYVRLTVEPNFTNITDVFTFSFLSAGGQGGGGLGGGQGGQGGGGFGGGGFGGGGFGGGGQGGGGGGFGFGGIGGFGGGGQGGGGFGGGQGGFGGGQGGQQGQQGAASQNVTVQQPVQEQVTVNTTVSVPDGGTVLLGGIKRLREGRNMAGVPILNKLPYISRLFKNTGVGRETESIMLMVTPRIIIQEEEEELLGIPL